MVRVLVIAVIALGFSICSEAQILTVPNGGTGNNTLAAHGTVLGNGTAPLKTAAPGATGQCFMANGSNADPSFQVCPVGITSINGDAAPAQLIQGAGTVSVATAGGTTTVSGTGGGSGEGSAYRWDKTTTAGDPGSGQIRSNNAAPGSATHLYASAFDMTGAGVFGLFNLVNGSDIFLYETNAVGTSIHYTCVGTPVNNGPNLWFDITVTLVTANAFTPNTNQSVQLYLPAGGNAVTAVTATAPLASSGGRTPNISLSTSGVTAGSYTNTSLTVDSHGLITAAANGSGGGGSTALNAITAATATNSIANGANTQTWNWGLTGANNGMVIGESAAGAGTGSLLEANALSSGVTALDAMNSAATSQIHFGQNTTSGGWLYSGATGTFISAGSELINGTWTAKGTSASSIRLNVGSSFAFNSSTGLTSGNTFTPTTIATLNAPTNYPQFTLNQPNSSTNAAGVLLGTNSSSSGILNVAGGATYSGSTWTASATGPNIISLGGTGGVFNLYGNSGLTIGNNFSPTLLVTISPAGMTVNGGIQHGTGMQHIRPASCTTTGASPNGNCTGTITWATAFADANYTVVCTPVTVTAGQFAVAVGSVTASSIGYILYTPGNTSGGFSAAIDCIAMHD